MGVNAASNGMAPDELQGPVDRISLRRAGPNCLARIFTLTPIPTQAYTLRVPQATIGIRGTDFMVAVVNPAFVSVINGSIGVSNVAGATTFGAGATGTVASSNALATAIPASSLPASVSASFSQLSSVVVSAAGAAEAAGAATGGITGGTAAAIAAGVAAAAAAASSNDQSSGATGSSGTH